MTGRQEVLQFVDEFINSINGYRSKHHIIPHFVLGLVMNPDMGAMLEMPALSPVSDAVVFYDSRIKAEGGESSLFVLPLGQKDAHTLAKGSLPKMGHRERFNKLMETINKL